jgi:GTP 3',8-cyclase
LRNGVVEIVRSIASLPETQDISMTTNAFLLAGMAADLYQAGLRRINISLDSLDAATFDQIVGIRSISLATGLGRDPCSRSSGI